MSASRLTCQDKRQRWERSLRPTDDSEYGEFFEMWEAVSEQDIKKAIPDYDFKRDELFIGDPPIEEEKVFKGNGPPSCQHSRRCRYLEYVQGFPAEFWPASVSRLLFPVSLFPLAFSLHAVLTVEGNLPWLRSPPQARRLSGSMQKLKRASCSPVSPSSSPDASIGTASTPPVIPAARYLRSSSYPEAATRRTRLTSSSGTWTRRSSSSTPSSASRG